MNRKYCVLLVLLLGSAGFIGVRVSAWHGSSSGKLESKRGSSPSRTIVRPIPTAVVYRLSATKTRTFPGTVRANRRVELAFSVPGLLKELNAQEGRSLRKGDVLAGLDPRDFQYVVEVAAAKHADALRTFERTRSLRDKGALPQAEYDKAAAAHNISKAELRIREKALEDSVLLAPFDGVVAKRYVEKHEHVKIRQPVVSFQDISLIEVVIQEPESLIAHGGAHSLRRIQVRFDADDDRWFDASVRESRAQSDSITGTYDVVVGLTPPAHLRVLPGMTATVRAETANPVEASELTVQTTVAPAEAVWSGSDGKSYVWIIKPDGGTPLKREVAVGALRESGVEILSGLEPGDQVAVAGVHTLRADMQVRPTRDGKEGLDG